MNYIIYLVHGGEDYNNEALCSLLSYYSLHDAGKNTVVLYTDNPGFFRKHLPDNVVYVGLDSFTLKDWKGDMDFNHRIKIKMLRDACSRFEGNIFYVDSDTYFTRNIDPLFAIIADNGILFHKDEGRLADNTGGVAKKMRKFLKKHNTFSTGPETGLQEIDESLRIWNAGVIGFNSTLCAKLAQVEELTDALYSKYPLFVMEQIAFNYVFQKISTPVSTDNYIHHYWYFKKFRSVLKHFFEHNEGKSFAGLINEVGKINPEPLLAERRNYKKLTFFEKQVQKLQCLISGKYIDYKL